MEEAKRGACKFNCIRCTVLFTRVCPVSENKTKKSFLYSCKHYFATNIRKQYLPINTYNQFKIIIILPTVVFLNFCGIVCSCAPKVLWPARCFYVTHRLSGLDNRYPFKIASSVCLICNNIYYYY